jgi:phosphohistidine phosphatase
MKRLLLMRHAKSDWADETLDDHDRPLNDRGRRDAPRMGRLLRERGIVPDLIVCSTAVRARETVELLAPAAGVPEPAIVHDRSLYLAAPMTLLSVARRRADEQGDPECVMVVAHNPGMAELASLLSGESVEFPTAALADCVLAIDAWDDLGDPSEAGVRVYRPKEL